MEAPNLQTTTLSPVPNIPEDMLLLSSNVLSKIEEVEQKMLEKDPNIKFYCAAIHKQLLQCPELVYILPPEAIGKHVRAIAQTANIEIAKAATEKSKSKALKNVSVSDLL